MHKLSTLQGVVRTFTTKAAGRDLPQARHQQSKELVSGGLITRMPLLQQDRDVLRII
jgi:hypothetical protein